MPSLNLGIVAHVDAGKTSLTERLLYEAGEIDAPGRVDDGTTSTDSMNLERARGITIRAAVRSFAIGNLAVTLIDTPGHPDFVAEVERSLTVLDAAVLVLSAVEGVQPQTVVLWRALQRIGLPTALFVNKVDRAGADVDRVVDQVRRRLSARTVVLSRAVEEGTRGATVRGVPLGAESVVSAVAEADDRVLRRWVAGEQVAARDIRHALRRGVREATLTPLVCGSAITGAGLSELRRTLDGLMPRAGEDGGEPAATVFAVDRDDRGRRAWLRVWSGEIRVRDRVAVTGGRPERITQLLVSQPGGPQIRDQARAGEVAVVRGPSGWRIGDDIGTRRARRRHRFPPPTRQALVEPIDPGQRTTLFAALTELADEDPLIGLRIDDTDAEAAVSLHGEVQKEVLGALLDDRYGVPVRFLQTSTVCIERVMGSGEAREEIGVDGNPYLATIGLRVDAAAVGHGVTFSPGVERGNLPAAFIAASEEGVRRALQQGRHGWAVTDCLVTMTASRYYPRQSHAHQRFSKAMSSVGADFRNLAPVVVMAALERAGTVVCEPVDRFELELPDGALTAVAPLLARLGATTVTSDTAAGWTRIIGHLVSARVADLTGRLADLTGGEGALVTRLDHYARVGDDRRPPERRRTGIDPRDRTMWFRHVPR
jgi:ribosomal protection tetracycline resistance protein